MGLNRLKIAGITAVSGLLVSAGCIAWSYHYGVATARTPFLPSVWKEKADVYAQSSDPGCVRGGMALDLIASGLLIGKPRSAVARLLGEPSGTEEAGTYYELGQCSGWGWHDSVLWIDFNRQHQVIDAAILRHR